MDLIFSYVHPSKPPKSVGPLKSFRLSFDGMRGNEDEKLLATYHRLSGSSAWSSFIFCPLSVMG